MKRWVAGGTALLFSLGLGLWEMGVQAGNHFPSGVLLAKKDKEKEEKRLKDKEEQLESKAKELEAKEEALKKKEEALKKWEANLERRSKRARRRVQQGAGLQQPSGAPAGFPPKTTNPQTMPQPNTAAPPSPQAPATATPTNR